MAMVTMDKETKSGKPLEEPEMAEGMERVGGLVAVPEGGPTSGKP